MSLHLAEQIADAVLYEGYVLYPYRASAAKNRFRWHIGLVTPRRYAEAAASDPWFMQTECLAEIARDASVTIRVRCLQVQERRMEVADGSGEWRSTDALMVDGEPLMAWDEGVVREFTTPAIPLAHTPHERQFPWQLSGGTDVERVRPASGAAAGRIVRTRCNVDTLVRVAVTPCDTLLKIQVRVENVTPCPVTALAERSVALRSSLAGTHALLSIERGAFVSLLEPPAPAVEAAGSCTNIHTWPVLVGTPPSRQVMLSSPIILYDYPAVAPESAGELCDGTEIDEMLMLRVKTLTQEEKSEARATDVRARDIVDRADAVGAAALSELHGAIRRYADVPEASTDLWQTFLNPPGEALPEEAALDLEWTRLTRGSPVRLKPGRRADAFDMFLAGRAATVTGIYRTLEGESRVAVILDDDPASTLDSRYRRSLFFHPDELAPPDGPAHTTLVAGIGNVFFGDDGFGVEVVQDLRRGSLPANVKVVETGIRVRDLAFELLDGNYRLAILVDAVRRGGPPGTLHVIEPEWTGSGGDRPLDGHAMSLEAVFGFLRTLGGTPPPIVIVGCEPERVDEGVGLSAPVAAVVEDARRLILDLVRRAASPAAAPTCV